MALAANIVLADAQATPVNHTFIPIGYDPSDPSTYWWEDQSQSNAIGFWRISASLKRPPNIKQGMSSANRAFRVAIVLHEPVLETLSNNTVSGILPAPTVAYVPKAATEYVMSERTDVLQRKSLRKMNYNLQANTQIIDMVENLVRIQG